MSGTNAHKTPVARSLNDFAEAKALRAIQVLGKALPCQVVSVAGQIVTVEFLVADYPTLPQVQMPIATSVYDWLPIQPGDQGVAFPADAYIGGVSGLGGGTADLRTPANLSALVFVPISKKSFSNPAGDDNFRVVQGPDGVFIQDTKGRAWIKLTPTGIFVHGPIFCDDTITAFYQKPEQVGLTTHRHTQPVDSHGDAEAETDPPAHGT